MKEKHIVMAAMLVATVVLPACMGPETRFTGALDGCGVTTATLIQRGAAAQFVPGDGTLVLTGTVAADGTLSASLNTQPPGKPPYLLSVSGHLDAAAATLTYVTPRCTAHGTLRRSNSGP